MESVTPNLAQDSSAVLLLPGMSLNHTIFPSLGVPIVAPDFSRLHFGADGSNPEIRDRGMDVYVDLLDQIISGSDVWETAQRFVVGHSFGGMLALSWLLRHRCSGPARVDGLVLTATTAGPVLDRVGLRLFRVQDFELRLGIRLLIPWWNRPGVTRAVKRLTCGGSLGSEQIDFQSAGVRTDLDLDLAGWRNTDWRAMRSYRLALADFDVSERLGEIEVPTIVLHGTDDSLFEPSVARELAGGLPRAALRMVRGAGHALPLTHGAAVKQAVRDLQQI
jgi:pimeloyl-ACP methyl ester carboxylesterase